MGDLFEAAGVDNDRPRPLADRLRPTSLADVIGQDHAVGPDGALTRLIAGGHIPNIILWGPPGTGKTTTARLLTDGTDLAFEQLSAIFSGVQELRKAFERARARRLSGQGTLLFIDEIHRFNRAQQDSFLPLMEDGTIVLVGATTENPSFELNAALLSRAKVIVLNRLDQAALQALLARAEEELGAPLPVDNGARELICQLADGDGRALLNIAEEIASAAASHADHPMDSAALLSLVQRRAAVYDKGQDGHYNLISALHKAVRGSDPDASLYWLCRMLDAGEDPMYLARRLIRMAVEDIGLASPQALAQANAAKQAYEMLGSPEGELALAQATVYLAVAPKSNAVYGAYKAAMRAAKSTGSLAPPKHILNAPTALMREHGYGEGYEYDHNAEGGISGQSYFPDGVDADVYYEPTERGAERDIAERVAAARELRRTRNS